MAWLHSAKVDCQAAIECVCSSIPVGVAFSSILGKILHGICISFVPTLSVKFRFQNLFKLYFLLLLKVFFYEIPNGLYPHPLSTSFSLSLLSDFETCTWVEESKIFLKVVSSHKIVFLWYVRYALSVLFRSM